MQKIFLTYFLGMLIISCNNNNRSEKTIETIMVQDSLSSTTVDVPIIEHDFGSVEEGQIVEFNYSFKNTGTNLLIVSNVTASCGCTVPEKPEAPVKPGETSYIKVKFNTTNRSGATRKTIFVTANTKPEFPQLILMGTVNKKTTKQ
ncbi:MAG: DUF1573 domain-containing protein [Ferruginibacter sp.]|nr:DUF1573 domain-containing protein [Ferruginibacter sp.]